MLMEEESKQGTNDFPKNKKKILIVDDDQTILYILRRFFVGRGFQVFVAKDGLGAMERLKTETPDIVLTDLKMPSLSGIDLINFIRQNTKTIPVIVMTASPSLYPENRKGNDVAGYFVKPFDIDEMFSSIQRILGG